MYVPIWPSTWDNARIDRRGKPLGVSKEAWERLTETNPGIDERIAAEVATWPNPTPEAQRLWHGIRRQNLMRLARNEDA